MQSAKTLWMLEVPYESIRGCVLVPLYAEDEQQAWIEASRWAAKRERTLPPGTALLHFPNGFTVHRHMLPGKLEEKTDE